MKRTLSKREKQVLKLLLAEYTQADIARSLNLSASRIQDIKMIIMKKWNVDGMVGITKQAILSGYLELEDDNFNYSNPTLTYSYINVEYVDSKEDTKHILHYQISNN